LPGVAPRFDVEAGVATWRGSPAVRGRLTALASATASLVLFLEHVPETPSEIWIDPNGRTPA
jgi:hypothetical protein